MSKSIFYFCFLFFSLSYGQNFDIKKARINEQEYAGQLSKVDFNLFLDFIKETNDFELKNTDSFIVNYQQPLENCFHSTYEKDDCGGTKWMEQNVYAFLKLSSNVKNLSYRATKLTKKCVEKFDKNGFILSNFIEKNELCHALIIVDNKGQFRMKIGEYMAEDIQKYLKELNIQ